jgi:hypothetical protein
MAAERPPSGPPRSADCWPRTRRPLPWMFAAFLALVFLVPVDAIQLKARLPFSPDLDRFVIASTVAVWAVGAVLGSGSRGVVRLRPRGWAAAMIAFFFLAIASIVVNLPRITALGEWAVTEKKLALLVAMVAIFAVFTLSLRVGELRAFSVLIVVLATITALGTIYEEKSGENLFYSTAASVLSPIATVEAAPTEWSGEGTDVGRPMVSGPTRHPLSVASLLGMSLPFAVMLAATAASFRRRLLWGLAACLVFSGALITQRRAGLVVPAAAMLTLLVLRPRQLRRLAPFGIVAVGVGIVASHGSFSSLQQLQNGGDSFSTMGRTSDYPAVVPDLLTNPILGRGYGTLNSARADTYRIFDNEYLGQAYQVGGLGLLAFLAVLLTPVVVARSPLRRDHPLRGPPAAAAAAGCIAFAVATALYDVLSFPQAPYLFLFMAAICTCAASVEVPAGAPRRTATGDRLRVRAVPRLSGNPA